MDFTREAAARVIDAHKPRGRATTRPVLLRAIGAELPMAAKLSWEKIDSFSFEALHEIALAAFSRDAPVLLTCEIRHKQRRLSGVHCLVAIRSSDEGIELIDSLGRRNGRIPNATLCRTACHGRWLVSGAPFAITKGSAFALVGLPPTC
jgi:hypothetical protein